MKKEQNKNFQNYYNNIFNEIHETINDTDTLKIGVEVLKVARDRLDGDFNNKVIKNIYNLLDEIIERLEELQDEENERQEHLFYTNNLYDEYLQKTEKRCASYGELVFIESLDNDALEELDNALIEELEKSEGQKNV